jgi:hypothetical protein
MKIKTPEHDTMASFESAIMARSLGIADDVSPIFWGVSGKSRGKILSYQEYDQPKIPAPTIAGLIFFANSIGICIKYDNSCEGYYLYDEEGKNRVAGKNFNKTADMFIRIKMIHELKKRDILRKNEGIIKS